MRGAKIVGRLEEIWQRGSESLQKLDEKTDGWLGTVGSGLKETLKPTTAISAAAISYFTLFSIFPLILLSITIASYNLNNMMGWQVIIRVFEFVAPALDQLLGRNIANIIRMRGPVTGVALAGLIWAGSTIFYTLNQTLNDIWGIKRVRPVWKRRGLAILLVLAVIGPVLLLISFTGSLIDNARSLMPDQLVIFERGVSFVMAVVLDVILLLVMYLLLPHGKSTWRDILPVAIVTGVLWELAKKAFLMFVTSYLDASNVVYGSVATIIAFLTWAYVSGLLFLFGAHLSCANYHRRKGKVNARE
jgi:membrane protein